MAPPAEPVYTVERLLDRRPRRGRGKPSYEFLVRWKGYDSSEDTWEPQEHILDASLIRAYERGLVQHPSNAPASSNALASGAAETSSTSIGTHLVRAQKPCLCTRLA